jgi:O-antigen/teichoic acid export membrane protein
MGIVIRQSIKSVAVTILGAMMGALIAGLSVKFFPKPELGFRDNLIKISVWISHLSLFGFNYTLLIFGQKYPPGHKARPTFLTISLLIPLGISVLICGGYFIALPYLDSLYQGNDAVMMRQYFLLFPLLTIFTAMITWLEGYLQSMHKTALQNFAREILARLVYIVLIILFGCGFISFSVFIWLYVICYLVPFFYLLLIAKRNPGFTFGFKKALFSLSEVKEIFRFSGYHMLTVVSTVLILQVDAFLLAPLKGFEVLAVYGIATLAVSMLRNPTRVIGIAATPAFTKSYNEGNIKELKDLFVRSAINMQIIAVILVGIVYININNIVEIVGMIQKGYDAIRWLIMILMLGQLFDMATGLNFELISVSKYYRFNFWIALVFMVIVFVLNFFLIKIWGMYGAAWATTIGLFIFNLSKTYFLWIKLKMQPFNTASLKIFAIAAIVGLIAWFIPPVFNVFVDLIIRSVVFGGLIWLALFKAKISPEINGITSNLIKNKKFY